MALKGILRKKGTYVKAGKGIARGIKETHKALTSPKAKATYRKIQMKLEKQGRKRRKNWADYDKFIGF